MSDNTSIVPPPPPPPATTPQREVVIETRALTKRFGTVTALDHVDLKIRQGEFLAFMGASGSGKTTLMNILTCLDTPTDGHVLVDGADLATLDDEGRRVFSRRKDRSRFPAIPPHPLPQRLGKPHARAALPQHGG